MTTPVLCLPMKTFILGTDANADNFGTLLTKSFAAKVGFSEQYSESL